MLVVNINLARVKKRGNNYHKLKVKDCLLTDTLAWQTTAGDV